ncbi:hypothetical protein KUTeg_000846 [Tegillarca granosa]|uniref:Uncharacterized protein n=1 Tax=Tegillarca granosa TaxID=220873 RepID=A0ABQ9G1K1_TEGGR|nr:hypothetical protein KUTeg_000846 [Tegillarca granosa]
MDSKLGVKSITLSKDRKCPEPPSIVNATIDPGNNLVGSTRQFTCENFPSCSKQITCQSNGTWTSITHMCETALCDAGWIFFGGSCYSMRYDITTWYNAKHELVCSNNNGSLVRIDTATENEYIKSLARQTCKFIKSQFHICELITTYDFWIDGTDEAMEGTWRYGSTGSIFDFTDWNPGQPNNYYNQDCAGLYRSFNFRWDDYSCNANRYYICEKSAVFLYIDMIRLFLL